MKKSKLTLLALPLFISSAMTGCVKDSRTTQEKVFAKIGSTFAVTGDYTLGQTMQMPDFETGEMTTMDMEMGTSTYTTYFCNDYLWIAQDIAEPEYHYDIRIDKDEDDRPINYQLDPFTNQIVPVYWSSNKLLKYNDLFANPFVNPDDFEVKKNKLVLKENNTFDFDGLGNILTLGNNATTLRTLTLEFDSKNKPTSFYAEFVNDSQSQFGFEMYFKYSGHFIDPKSVNVASVPTPIPAQAGQDLLENKFATLRELNYTATTTIYDGNTKVTDVTVKVNPTHAYIDFENTNPEYSYMNFYDKGFFQNDNGLNYYKIKEGVPTATNYPVTTNSYSKILSDIFKVSGYTFNVNSDGTYTLPSYEFATPIHYYLGTEALYVGGFEVDKGTFNVTLTDAGLDYSYTSDAQYRVQTSITAVGSTTIPVDLTTFVEYAPATNIVDWATNQAIPQLEFVVNDITGNNSDLIPFFEGTGRNDGFIDVGVDSEMNEFGAGFEIAQACANETEEMELFMNFMTQMESKDGYSYHLMDDEYVYGSEGDDVYFKVSIRIGMYINQMTGAMYEHTVTLRVINLNTPEGWVNPWDEM